MKKVIFIVAFLATTIPMSMHLYGQIPDEWKSSTSLSINDTLSIIPDDQKTICNDDADLSFQYLTPEGQDLLNKLIRKDKLTIVDEDQKGSYIFRQPNGKYAFYNIPLCPLALYSNKDNIKFININNDSTFLGLLIKSGKKLEICSTLNDAIIPPTLADTILTVLINPFKSKKGQSYGYAVLKYNNSYYAVATNGICHKLSMGKVYIKSNLIFGYKDGNILFYTPDGSTQEEVVFDASNLDVKYTEVNILETIGKGRYSYAGVKYSNISPGLVVKKGHHYTLYPQGKKLHVKKISNEEMIGTVDSQKVYFSPKDFHAFDTPKNIDEYGY